MIYISIQIENLFDKKNAKKYYVTELSIQNENSIYIKAYKYDEIIVDHNFSPLDLQILWNGGSRLNPDMKLVFKDRITKRKIFEQGLTGEWTYENLIGLEKEIKLVSDLFFTDYFSQITRKRLEENKQP